MTLLHKKLIFLLAASLAVLAALWGLQRLLQVKDEQYFRRQADVAFASRNWAELQEIARVWQQAEPRSSLAVVAEGDARFRAGQFAEAISAYERALKMEQGSAEVWARYGASLFNNQRYADALRACRTSQQINPDFPEAIMCEGVVYAFTGDVRKLDELVVVLNKKSQPLVLQLRDVVKTHACAQQRQQLGSRWCGQ